MSNPPQASCSARQPPAWRGWTLLIASLIATFLLGMLGASILQRRWEATREAPLHPIGDMEMDAARWGENYPNEYDSYMAMYHDAQQTKYGGGGKRDYLQATPANVILFAGNKFADDYRQAREHVWAIDDVQETLRRTPGTPATCATCKSPDVPRLMVELGDPDKERLLDKMNPRAFYKKSFDSVIGKIEHPIGCFDCHDPGTMALRISRPALREALESQQPQRDLDRITHQEMRSLVCAQCHVEYYFQTDKQNEMPEAERRVDYLAFPWQEGTTPEAMEEYYDKADFSDWQHAISQADMIKIQHPDYEVYRTGVHAYRNVSCADCHMPYKTVGGMKFTSHRVRSPLLDIANSCAVCHRWSEKEIRDRVEAIQDKVREGRQRAEAALARAHFDIAAARQAGATREELAGVRKLVRAAQLRWDYVAANNGMGFHSPQECMRVLGAAVDLAGQCRVECARILGKYGITAAVQYPDFSSKEKAQAIVRQFKAGKPPSLLPVKKP
jgi:nitrite reductase (cytochrome c-552)